MPIPPTRYIDAGPGLPQANPQTAMASGIALSRFGETIAAIGERGLQIAADVRRHEEAGAVEANLAQIEKESADFQNSLLTRSDTAEWPKELGEKMGDWKSRIAGLGLSPEGRARAEERFADWRTRRTIQLEAGAASKGVEMARQQIVQSLDYYRATGNKAAHAAALRAGRESGILSPADVQKAQYEWNLESAKQGLLDDFKSDPDTALARLKSGAWRKETEGSTPELESWGINMAEGAAKEKTMTGIDQAYDLAASGELTSRDQVEKDPRTAWMRPALRRRVGDYLESIQSDEFKARQQTPEFQAEKVGEITSQIRDWTPETDDKEDPVYGRLVDAAKSLPAGSGAREEMDRLIKDKRAGKWQEIKTAKDIADFALDENYKAGKFGSIDTPGKMTVAEALKGGFLQDREKLALLGWNKAQVAEIVDGENPEKQTDAKRAAAVQRLWLKRGFEKEGIDPLVQKTGEAIYRGATEIDYVNPESVDAALESRITARRKLGAARLKVAEYVRINPKATVEEIDNQILELTEEDIRKAKKEGLVPARARRATPGADENTSDVPKGGNLKEMVKEIEAGGEPKKFFPKAYWDVRQWSIGYGTRSKEGEVIDEAEASKRLDTELAGHRARVIAQTKHLNLEPHQIDALTSFDYNTGDLEQLLAGGTRGVNEIAKAMPFYRNSDGKRSKGLENRRKAEQWLFLHGYPGSADDAVKTAVASMQNKPLP